MRLYPIPNVILDLVLITKNKITQPLMDIIVQEDFSVKTEKKRKDKEVDLIKGLINLWSMKVTVSGVVVGTAGTYTEGLEKRL